MHKTDEATCYWYTISRLVVVDILTFRGESVPGASVFSVVATECDKVGQEGRFAACCWPEITDMLYSAHGFLRGKMDHYWHPHSRNIPSFWQYPELLYGYGYQPLSERPYLYLRWFLKTLEYSFHLSPLFKMCVRASARYWDTSTSFWLLPGIQIRIKHDDNITTPCCSRMFNHLLDAFAFYFKTQHRAAFIAETERIENRVPLPV